MNRPLGGERAVAVSWQARSLVQAPMHHLPALTRP